MCRLRFYISSIALGGLALGGCSDGASTPRAALRPQLSADAIKFWEASATVRWNEIARTQTLTHVVSQQSGTRTFAYLSLAQYNAAVTAEEAKDRGDHASVAAAVAAASSTVLGSFYPDQAAYFDAQVADQESEAQWPGENHDDFGAGEAVGRAVGAAVVASAATDRFTSSVAGVTIPVCPGCWVSAPGKVPVFPRLAEMRTFFLTSSSQFRPAPPPAFGSPAFETALAEVRFYSDNRTHEQDSLAKFWASPNGFTNVAQSYTNQVATDEITKFHLDEVRAARVLAIMNMAAMDAFIASHDAKYTYWMIRPPQADPGIVPDIPLPNHPSYPSNHASVTGSSMAVLAAHFPSDANYLNGLADQAAISRIYAGIHYRFDMDAGLTLGRTVASYALEHDVNGHEAYALK
ncbi:MAG TPA: vanadium-dependent haloperoxidase [Gemmatimonadaceae bacterium]|jgi:hypothetical protein